MSEYTDKIILQELADIRRAVEDLVDAFKMLARVIGPDRAKQKS